MAVDLSVSEKAPILPGVEVDGDLTYAFDEFSRVHGNKAVTQQSLKALQALPLVYAGLSVKERGQMSKTDRDRAASKCMQEIAIPGFIKLFEAYEATKGRPVPMPHKWKDMIYYTTLGTGGSTAYTFMQKPATVLTKYGPTRRDYVKVVDWFHKHGITENPSDLNSGSNTQDTLVHLNHGMYFKSDGYIRASKKADEGADKYFAPRHNALSGAASTNPLDVTLPAAGAAGGVPAEGGIPAGAGPAAMAALTSTATQPAGAGEAATDSVHNGRASDLAAQAAARLRQEKEATGATEDGEEGEVPDSWFFPYLILTAAYSPWGNNTPSEWKHLESSSGPKKRKSPTSPEVTLDASNPVCNPKAMGRINPNGDAFSRRQLAAAIKKEKEAERKATKDKENEDARKEALSAMKDANNHAKAIGENIAKIALVKEREAVCLERENRIKALERKLMLGLGDKSVMLKEIEKMLQWAHAPL